jgi:sporadic carbohydrate cluster 2OG-Fe(II) oxygenase
MFLSADEQLLSAEYLQRGYIIRPVADDEALDWIKNHFSRIVAEILDISNHQSIDDLLNSIHTKVPVLELNTFRLKVIRAINALPDFREKYFRVAKPYLETLAGNELAMQTRINLSIQYPADDSSLLPLHADTWSGDSAFEIVVWLPLVNCYGTKAMYILCPEEATRQGAKLLENAEKTSEDLFRSVETKLQYLEVKVGEVLLFNQTIPHGNRVNNELETRWSMNARFKSIFTPYGDKKLGEFFDPITLRAASRIGMDYNLPKLR